MASTGEPQVSACGFSRNQGTDVIRSPDWRTRTLEFDKALASSGSFMWHRIASLTEIPDAQGREFTIGDRIVAVFQNDGKLYAMDGICPHAGGPLGEGTLVNGIVTCPWHGWQFEISSGKHCLTPQIQQTCYAVKIEGEDVFVELP